MQLLFHFSASFSGKTQRSCYRIWLAFLHGFFVFFKHVIRCNSWITIMFDTPFKVNATIPENSPPLECRRFWQNPSHWSMIPLGMCMFRAISVEAYQDLCQRSCTGVRGYGCPPVPAWRTHWGHKQWEQLKQWPLTCWVIYYESSLLCGQLNDFWRTESKVLGEHVQLCAFTDESDLMAEWKQWFTTVTEINCKRLQMERCRKTFLLIKFNICQFLTSNRTNSNASHPACL